MLVAAPEGLEIEPESIESNTTFHLDRTWNAAIVRGDFGLRWALARQDGPLAAVVTCSPAALQPDLRERAVLRRVVPPLARDLFASLAGRECAAIDETRFRPALVALLARSFDRVAAGAAGYTWGRIVQETDALTLLGSVALDVDSGALPESAAALLARWLRVAPAFDAGLDDLVKDMLVRRFPSQASLLQAALRRGVRPYVAEFAGTERSSRAHAPSADEALITDALSRLHRDEPSLLHAVLADAEAAFIKSRRPPAGFPLLANAYRTRLHEIVRACQDGAPPGDGEIAGLDAFLFADASEITTLRAIARLARAVGAAGALPRALTIEAFGDAYCRELAWGDLAARRARDADVATLDSVSRETIAALVTRWLELRDEWNASFAAHASRDWSNAVHGKRRKGPLSVHRVLGEVVRPIVHPNLPDDTAGHKVFLVVLDGCDLASFYEIVRALEQAGIAPIVPPKVSGLPLLSDDAGEATIPRVALGIAPIPTMTGHARRALFAGMIPDAIVLDEREAQAASASADGRAFDRAVPLGTATRRLFLKGDLADGGTTLRSLLETRESAPDIVAAVFNEVDDSLSSSQRGVLPEWRLGNLGALAQALAVAARSGWITIITADHGNTPYRGEPDLRVNGFAGARYAELPQGPAPVQHSVVFEKGDSLPRRIAALYRVGEHGSSQHVGYHGGASLEEVFVPIACLGAGTLDARAIYEPAWWLGLSSSRVASLPLRVPDARPLPAKFMHGKPEGELMRRIADVLDERNYAIVTNISANQVLDANQIAKSHQLKPGMVHGRIEAIIAQLAEAGIPDCLEVDEERRRYIWRLR